MNLDSLPHRALLALDTVALIYFLEKHPSFFPISKKLFQGIEENRYSGVISSVVFAELLVPAFRAGRLDEASRVQNILAHFPHLEIAPLTSAISVEAARLRARYGIRTPDAIHVATAIHHGASGFVTNDKGLLQLQNEIPIFLFEGP